MNGKRIIMNFTVAPSHDDIEAMVDTILDHLPEEISDLVDGISIVIEEFPDESIEQELELEDPFDLLALFRSGREISPGVEKKSANDDDVLILYRRPILDLWCESGDELNLVLRNVIVEELGQNLDFSEDEIEEMSARHFQGML
ncbi:MAG: metallopeptidase family protein [Micavibrio sp.]|nr:metallopeptidase family protein [Micavibrio sp.]